MAVGSVAVAAAAAGREERMVGWQSEAIRGSQRKLEAINDTHQLRGEKSEWSDGNQRQSEAIRGN
jgi:hypothetical protein